MTNYNHNLTAQLNLTLSSLCIAIDNIAALQAQLNALTSNGTGGGGRAIGSSNFRGTGNATGGGGGTLSGIPENTSRRHRFDFNLEPRRKVFDNKNYYHTHGYHVAAAHTSLTCKKTGKSHKTTATRANIMGDCTRDASISF